MCYNHFTALLSEVFFIVCGIVVDNLSYRNFNICYAATLGVRDTECPVNARSLIYFIEDKLLTLS